MARTLLTDLDPTAIFTPSLFIRREAFLNLGGFDAAAFGGEDYELGWRLKQQGVPIAYHPYFVVRHRDPPIGARTGTERDEYGLWGGLSNIESSNECLA